ncbi:ras-related and estrogen-regulated growth inhibitor-like [Limulus polyphemus]|uniref:small monomeric GTPase n=1 Tax=Limulus polyphemus TaxID=6850 RepID=A0ABM1C5Q9_LIMPO|nr:ras-related and estrogen-regulated growth inhibitor-like [Limulus polyphemus]
MDAAEENELLAEAVTPESGDVLNKDEQSNNGDPVPVDVLNKDEQSNNGDPVPVDVLNKDEQSNNGDPVPVDILNKDEQSNNGDPVPVDVLNKDEQSNNGDPVPVVESAGQAQEDVHTAHIVVFGKDGTGKSAFIVRFLTKRFIHEYDPTSEDVYAYNSQIDGRKICLKIMDTAGKVERTVHKREEQIRWGDGFILVLSLASRDSLKEVVRIKEVIEHLNESEKPVVLVATKRDLVHAREVTSAEIQELAKRWHCRTFETAATEDYITVAEPFISLFKDIRKIKEQKGLFPTSFKLDKDIVIADVHKRYKNRLLTQ